MKRRRTVYADAVLTTYDGQEIPVVTDEHLIDEVAKLLPQLNFSGGVLTVLTARVSTGLEHEMVTTKAAIEWKDRTDARPQPEPVVEVAPEPVEVPEPGELDEALEAGVSDLEAAREVVARTADPDEEEDLSSIPAAAR